MSSAGARTESTQAVDKAANSRDEAAIDLIEAILPNSDQKTRFPDLIINSQVNTITDPCPDG